MTMVSKIRGEKTSKESIGCWPRRAVATGVFKFERGLCFTRPLLGGKVCTNNGTIHMSLTEAFKFRWITYRVNTTIASHIKCY